VHLADQIIFVYVPSATIFGQYGRLGWRLYVLAMVPVDMLGSKSLYRVLVRMSI
jgi:hypothetical protein